MPKIGIGSLGIGVQDSTLAKGGTDYVAQILGAGGLDYGEFDFTRLSLLFQDAAGTTPITTTGQTIGRANVKAKAPHNAQQATSSFRPQYQAAGAKFDGSDDNQLSDWVSQSGANCMILQASVPATLSSTLVIAGAQDGSSTNKFWLGVGTNGSLICALGQNTMAVSATDNRGTDVVMALTCDGTTVNVFVNNAETYSRAQVGVPTTVTALRLGALNANGTAALFWPGSIRRAAFGKKMITRAEFLQIRSQWLAA